MNTTPKTLASIDAYKKYRMSRSCLQYDLINLFFLSEEVKECLEIYNLLHWNGPYLNKALKDGLIIHEDNAYVVVFHNCTPWSARHADRIKVSFRKPAKEFKLPAYVLISILEEKKS